MGLRRTTRVTTKIRDTAWKSGSLVSEVCVCVCESKRNKTPMRPSRAPSAAGEATSSAMRTNRWPCKMQIVRVVSGAPFPGCENGRRRSLEYSIRTPRTGGRVWSSSVCTRRDWAWWFDTRRRIHPCWQLSKGVWLAGWPSSGSRSPFCPRGCWATAAPLSEVNRGANEWLTRAPAPMHQRESAGGRECWAGDLVEMATSDTHRAENGGRIGSRYNVLVCLDALSLLTDVVFFYGRPIQKPWAVKAGGRPSFAAHHSLCPDLSRPVPKTSTDTHHCPAHSHPTALSFPCRSTGPACRCARPTRRPRRPSRRGRAAWRPRRPPAWPAARPPRRAPRA